MKKLLTALAAVATAAGMNAETYRINVGEFTELVLDDNINVTYSSAADSTGYVVFDIKPEYASYIMTEASKGKLRIQLDQAAQQLTGLPTVYAYSSFLAKVENSKDSTLTVRGVAPCAKFEAELQGNGKIIANDISALNINLRLVTGKGTIIASGKCDNLSIKSVGTGEIQADEIDAKDVSCAVMGTGTIGCAPRNSLKIRGLGTGKVYYTGSPEISKNKLSTIKLIKLDSEETPAEAETEAEPEETDTPATNSERRPVGRN